MQFSWPRRIVGTLAIIAAFTSATATTTANNVGDTKTPLPDLAALLTDDAYASAEPIQSGSRVAPGPHWRYGGFAANGEGTVLGPSTVADGWWRVRWDSGHTNAYRFSAGAYELVVLPSAPLPTLRVAGRVPRVVWPDRNVPFAEQVAARDEPVVLRNTRAEDWAARNAWTWDHLAQHLPSSLSGIKVTPRQPFGATPFFYSHGAPLQAVDGATAAYEARAYNRTNMTTADLLARLADSSHPDAVTYASKLDAWGVAFLRDTLPLDPFMVIQPGFDPAKEHLYRQTHVWLGGANTSTPCHFDLFHNFYVHLAGTKRFLLFPPGHWQHLYLHPLIHPAGRSAQVDLDGDPAAQRATFPHYDPTQVQALEAVLEPGDGFVPLGFSFKRVSVAVLYIPPLWFHHVTSLTRSLSISVWSPDTAIELAAKAAENVPLPIKRAWSPAQRVAGLRIFLESLVESLKMDMNVAEFVHWTLLDNRFVHGVADVRGPFCEQKEISAQVLLEAESLLRAQLRTLIQMFRDVRRRGGPDRMVIELANYFELTANAVVGPAAVHQFLKDLVYC